MELLSGCPQYSACYFNPNWNNSYYYSLIKSLCLIYDRIILWSPNINYIYDHEILTHAELRDFFSASIYGPDVPVLIPAGRSGYFKIMENSQCDIKKLIAAKGKEYGSVLKESDNDFVFRGYFRNLAAKDSRLRAILHQQSDAINVIYSSFQLDQLLRSYDRLHQVVPADIITAIKALGEDVYSLEKACVLPNYFTDIWAMKQLQSVFRQKRFDIIVKPGLEKGYDIIDAEHDFFQKECILPSHFFLKNNAILSNFDEIRKYLEYVKNAQYLSWKDIVAIRNMNGGEVIREINRATYKYYSNITNNNLTAFSAQKLKKLEGKHLSTADKLTPLITLGGLSLGAYTLGLPDIAIQMPLAVSFINNLIPERMKFIIKTLTPTNPEKEFLYSIDKKTRREMIDAA